MSKKVILLLSAAGLAVSTYLAWTYLSGSSIACTTHGCDAVRSSSYANLFGVPQPLFGIIFYLMLIFLSLALQILDKFFTILLKRLIIVVSAFGFLYSVYLTLLEAFVIKAYCDWCLASAAISTLIFIIVLRDYFYAKNT
ncbi:MAG: hypothetical protein A2172_04830 [Candidatus Woykebacteria bacterium RBG_13_40_15]|uniref:Vitamin K epoxide reductase domain-containing protein n=1 Tax=Candidatus Woykebacteria bacterium RBG_13_40_15 TaxID=1802593 RepID=A0A1G1W7C0_9BACT|nr:MAG: hypothetical protein A2172_04830 [Candidatus Woykebacteria bacterium RBG_13_40_15]